MNKLIAIASCLLALALLSTGVRAQDQGVTTVPPALVTADQLEAKLTEVEADPGLDGDAKGRLVALYRKALSNLEEVAANRSRADAFAETTGRSTPSSIRRGSASHSRSRTSTWTPASRCGSGWKASAWAGQKATDRDRRPPA